MQMTSYILFRPPEHHRAPSVCIIGFNLRVTLDTLSGVGWGLVCSLFRTLASGVVPWLCSTSTGWSDALGRFRLHHTAPHRNFRFLWRTSPVLQSCFSSHQTTQLQLHCRHIAYIKALRAQEWLLCRPSRQNCQNQCQLWAFHQLRKRCWLWPREISIWPRLLPGWRWDYSPRSGWRLWWWCCLMPLNLFQSQGNEYLQCSIFNLKDITLRIFNM